MSAAVEDIGSERLIRFVERIERLEGEKSQILEDIKQVYAEAKMDGFDTKTMRKIIHLRALDDGERSEQEVLLDLYKRAVGLALDLKA